MRNEINLTDEQIETIYEDLGVCLCADEDLVLTRETISDFMDARANWSLPGKVTKDATVDGRRVLVISSAQAMKGQPKHDLYIVDFGSVRTVYK